MNVRNALRAPVTVNSAAPTDDVSIARCHAFVSGFRANTARTSVPNIAAAERLKSIFTAGRAQRTSGPGSERPSGSAPPPKKSARTIAAAEAKIRIAMPAAR